MKLCFSTLGCPDWTLDKVAENGAKYGFDGVELRIADGHHINPSFDARQRENIRKMFDGYGLEIVILSGYTQFCWEDEAELEANGEALLKNAQLAADLNVPYLRTFMGANGDFTQKGAEVLKKYCDQAYEMGVIVLAEIHDSMNTGERAAQILQEVNSPGFQILWDVHHSITAGEALEKTWEAVGSHVYHVHMKDADADNKPCLLAEGVLPLQQITDVLKKGGYKGHVSFEWEKTWIRELEEPEVALPQYVSYMKKLLDA